MKKFYILAISIMSSVFLLISFTPLNNRAEHQYQGVRNKYFSLSVPSNWKVKSVGGSAFDFGKNKEDDIGGVYRMEFNVNFNAGEKSLPSKEALLLWMLPNHKEVTKTLLLSGFFTETYIMHVITSESASQGGKITGVWTYVIFVDKNKSTSTRFVAYKIFLNTKYVSERGAIHIAKSFKTAKME